ncbi:uroporphyrinogen decarboxylase family protein [Emticicia sp. BO119]|uniref:uroporphyrinogen decarboxylase family protein n=1 Tax=Emticicia sp. BO119 TaxID=2757768 RepID=UPI0015F06118|nr:uroporphyrinogen decarboxylase family protein [Emticicia sp. BO119]MBA4848947.1 hypothetical protein [Emticicia sp. BO119]
MSFWKHHPVADQKGETLAAKTLEFQRKFKCDFIKITPAGSWQAVCYGVADTWNGDSLGRRVITQNIIKRPEDWLTLPDFSKKQIPFFQEILKACSLVCQDSDDNTPILSTVFCPISQAIQMAGLPVFLNHIIEHPREVLEGLEHLTRNTLFIIEELIKAGSDGIYFVAQHMQDGILSPDTYKIFGEYFDAQCLDVCKNLLFNIFHIHGTNIFPAIGNIPANCYIHYEYASAANFSLSFLKKYEQQILVGLPLAEMVQCRNEDEIQQLIIGKSRGNIITSGCVLPLGFPDESILEWMRVSKNIS